MIRHPSTDLRNEYVRKVNTSIPEMQIFSQKNENYFKIK